MDILSILIFLPFFGGLVLLALPLSGSATRKIGFAVTAVTFLLGLEILAGFQPGGGLQWEQKLPWIDAYGIIYHIGLDALSLPALLALLILAPALFLGLGEGKSKGYWANLLVLQGGVTGALLSLDLVLFYLFWEMMLLPVFFMIGIYGHEDRVKAAMKVTLYTMLGSLLMLASILYLGLAHFKQEGFWSFELANLQNVVVAPEAAGWVFLGFLIAFAIKIPLFPLHTWLADTYEKAPGGAVVLLSAVMAKLGVYGLLRYVLPLFPVLSHEYAPLFLAAGILGLLYFGIAAIMQNDIKRMFAYSSGSHLSLIVIGIFTLNLQGLSGAMVMVAVHAVASGGLFLLAELMEERTGTRKIDELGGIAAKAPLFAFLFAVLTLTVIGLPGTGGFTAELLIVLGSFRSGTAEGVLTATTVIVAVLFMLWMFQRTVLQSPGHKVEHFPELKGRELLAAAPLVVLALLLGLYPQPFVDLLEPGLTGYLERMGGVCG